MNSLIEKLPARERHLVAVARDFAARHIRPAADDWERARRFPDAVHRLAGEAGLTLLLLDRAKGGNGVSPAAAVLISEELAAGDLSFALPVMAHNYVAWAVADHAPPAFREDMLPKLRAGMATGAFALTEPGAGSDASAITTRARRDGAGWVLNGEKAWVLRGTDADFLLIYAQTDPQAGHRGIALFLVEASRAGVTKGAPYDLLGGHAMGVNSVGLSEVRIPSENMLVPAGEGLRFGLKAIDYARATVAGMACGLLRDGLDTARAYTIERQAFGQSVLDFQGVEWMLADAATDLEAARLLTQRAAAALDSGEDRATAAAHAKKFATRVALNGLSSCMQVMGANSLRRDHAVGRQFLSAKIAMFLDGSTQIQNVVIGRALRKAPLVPDAGDRAEVAG
ncbi:MAG: acyl-CoA dehydrogenase family protein [Paracoccaceae bacterium]